MVHCAARNGPAIISATEALGGELVRSGCELVYGGGNIGLMGTVARAVHAHGGVVRGVMPAVSGVHVGRVEACVRTLGFTPVCVTLRVGLCVWPFVLVLLCQPVCEWPCVRWLRGLSDFEFVCVWGRVCVWGCVLASGISPEVHVHVHDSVFVFALAHCPIMRAAYYTILLVAPVAPPPHHRPWPRRRSRVTRCRRSTSRW